MRLGVEGGLRTGRDVVMAAAMGADDFAFGSAALVAAGCVMARQCHLNTCPAGIATQREDLRRNFHATPENALRFLSAVAEEVREILSSLGKGRLDDVVGDVGLIAARNLSGAGRASRVSAEGLLKTASGLERPASRPSGRPNPSQVESNID